MARICWIGAGITVFFGILLALFNCYEASEESKLN